jgi:hypothetical protein
VAAVIAAGSANVAVAARGVLAAVPFDALPAARLPELLRPMRAKTGGGAHARTALRSAPSTTANAVVTSCADDGGFDTLRHAVLTADPSDTIDLSTLNCSKITLQSGAISVTVSDLKIRGPGSGALTIDAHHASRVFEHNGTGTLSLSGLSLVNGTRAADKAYGGCIYASGSVVLDDTIVSGCSASGQTYGVAGAILSKADVELDSSTVADSAAVAAVGEVGMVSAAGGGVVALGEITLTDSVISGNVAQAPTGKSAAGGVLSPVLTAKYSTLTGNQAIAAGTATSAGIGGAAYVTQVLLRGSTVDHNVADVAGAMYVNDVGNSTYTTILQSTISTNSGNLAFGGIVSKVTLNIANSTIAFNTAGSYGGPAVGIFSGVAAMLDSTIIADNSPLDLDGGGAIGGANNLIKVAGQNVTVPPGTFTLDPQLGPLQSNGGRTRTHALMPGSPAINQGDDEIGMATDQRGLSYRRVVGNKADIGAFEVDDDHIFGDALEATPPLL